jgi:protease-4
MNRRNAFRSFLKAGGIVLVVVILPLAVGILLSLYLIPIPQVAVIRISGDIWGDYSAYISQALEKAEKDRAVHAVVLEIVSPGGEVTASEDLYFAVLKLRAKKPVVASVDELAASGAYYIASAADQIYAKAASIVGNIGVISILSDADVVDETVVTTGPFKLSGGSPEEQVRRMDMLKQSFLAAVLAQRGDRLRVGPEVLSRGEVYLGLQAQQQGLVDEIGSQGEAVAAAARLARLRHYEVIDRTPELPEGFSLFGSKLQSGSTAETVAAPPAQLPPGFYYRYVEPPQ